MEGTYSDGCFGTSSINDKHSRGFRIGGAANCSQTAVGSFCLAGPGDLGVANNNVGSFDQIGSLLFISSLTEKPATSKQGIFDDYTGCRVAKYDLSLDDKPQEEDE